MDETEWVRTNVTLIGEMGAASWLLQLLDVLNGDIVTAEEVGLTPPDTHRGYSRPTRAHRRRGKKKQKKRHRR